MYSRTVKSLMTLELRLIKRNLRPMVSLILFLLITIFLLTLIFTQKEKFDGFYSFVTCIFITGLYNLHSNLSLAWESNFFELLMTTPIKLKDFLQAKFNLNVIVSFLGLLVFVLVSLLLNFHDYIIYAVTAFFYNVGIYSYILYFMAKYNNKAIKDLNGFGQGTTIGQVISALFLVAPGFIISTLSAFMDIKFILISFVVISIIGILMNKILLNFIAKEIGMEKHHLIASFNKTGK